MSSHQNSAFHGESALELAQPRLPRYQTGVRAARPQVRSSPRISRAPDEIWGQRHRDIRDHSRCFVGRDS